MHRGLQLITVLLLSCTRVQTQWLTVTYGWSNVDFLYNNKYVRSSFLSSKEHVPDSVIILDADIYDGRVFVTTPSLLPGTPATLSTLPLFSEHTIGSPLIPFPNWSWHNVTNKNDCEKIKSVFRIDKLGRLWVVDSGVTNAFSDRKSRGNCNPKILIFDLNNNDKLIRKYEIDKILIDDDSLLLNIDVQLMSFDGAHSFAYIADSMGTRLIVYDFFKNSIIIHQHPFFFPDPAYGFYNLNGKEFTVTDGLFTLAIGLCSFKSDDIMFCNLDEVNDVLFFHTLSSGHECMVSAALLRNGTLSETDSRKFVALPDRPFHASSEVLTHDGILVFPNMEENSIYAWDTSEPYDMKNFYLLARDKDALQFPTGMKITQGKFIIVTARLQNVLVDGVPKKGELNYRILIGDASYLSRLRLR